MQVNLFIFMIISFIYQVQLKIMFLAAQLMEICYSSPSLSRHEDLMYIPEYKAVYAPKEIINENGHRGVRFRLIASGVHLDAKDASQLSWSNIMNHLNSNNLEQFNPNNAKHSNSNSIGSLKENKKSFIIERDNSAEYEKRTKQINENEMELMKGKEIEEVKERNIKLMNVGEIEIQPNTKLNKNYNTKNELKMSRIFFKNLKDLRSKKLANSKATQINSMIQDTLKDYMKRRKINEKLNSKRYVSSNKIRSTPSKGYADLDYRNAVAQDNMRQSNRIFSQSSIISYEKDRKQENFSGEKWVQPQEDNNGVNFHSKFDGNKLKLRNISPEYSNKIKLTFEYPEVMLDAFEIMKLFNISNSKRRGITYRTLPSQIKMGSSRRYPMPLAPPPPPPMPTFFMNKKFNTNFGPFSNDITNNFGIKSLLDNIELLSKQVNANPKLKPSSIDHDEKQIKSEENTQDSKTVSEVSNIAKKEIKSNSREYRRVNYNDLTENDPFHKTNAKINNFVNYENEIKLSNPIYDGTNILKYKYMNERASLLDNGKLKTNIRKHRQNSDEIDLDRSDMVFKIIPKEVKPNKKRMQKNIYFENSHEMTNSLNEETGENINLPNKTDHPTKNNLSKSITNKLENINRYLKKYGILLLHLDSNSFPNKSKKIVNRFPEKRKASSQNKNYLINRDNFKFVMDKHPTKEFSNTSPLDQSNYKKTTKLNDEFDNENNDNKMHFDEIPKVVFPKTEFSQINYHNKKYLPSKHTKPITILNGEELENWYPNEKENVNHFTYKVIQL